MSVDSLFMASRYISIWACVVLIREDAAATAIPTIPLMTSSVADPRMQHIDRRGLIRIKMIGHQRSNLIQKLFFHGAC